MTRASTKKYVGNYGATERVLASGAPIIPGEPFELTDEEVKDPHNARLLKDEQFVEYTPSKKGDSS